MNCFEKNGPIIWYKSISITYEYRKHGQYNNTVEWWITLPFGMIYCHDSISAVLISIVN